MAAAGSVQAQSQDQNPVAPRLQAGVGSTEPAATQLDDVVVTGVPFGINARATTLATTVMNAEALAVAPATSLGDLVNGLPGVRSTDFSPGASRPVIRGLSGPRVQVLTHGLGLIDASSVSPDHQVATDPGEANRIEIIRGPATLAYGGTAIGGVVNVMDDRIPEAHPDGLDGRLLVQGSTVDEGRALSGRFTVDVGPVVLSLDALDKRTQDYDIPAPPLSRRLAARDGLTRLDTGTQANSASELQTWGAGASWIGERGFIGVAYKSLGSTYGVVAEPQVFIDLDQTRRDLRGAFYFEGGPFQALTGSYGQSNYTHTEFEAPGVSGTVFRSQGQEGRLDLVQRPHEGWAGAIGIQALDRAFEARGDEAYLPPSTIREFGLYTVQRLDRPTWGLEGGLRLDRHVIEAEPLGAGPRLDRTFDNGSASLAVFVRPNPALFLGISLSHNARAPSEVELLADGLHVATGAYERGDVTLGSEAVNTMEGTAHVSSGRFQGDLHLYISRYDGFIDERPTGADYVDGAATYPVFAFVQTDATFKGFEAEARYDLWNAGHQGLALELTADAVRATTDLGPAARIPPWSVTGRLAWTSSPADASIEVRHVATQTRVAQLELPTDGYTLVNLTGHWRPWGDEQTTVFAELSNLTNAEAREHASALKDIAVRPGRNLRVGISHAF